MARRSQFFLGLATAAVFILLEIAAIALLKSSAALQDVWVNRFSHNVSAVFWKGLTQTRDYFSLREQNDILAGRNYALFKELQQYKELAAMAGARSLLDSAELEPRFNYIPAEIASMGTNSRHNFIVLNKGAADGVTPYSAVITPQGVVGIINSVDRKYSYALSFLNERVSVSARLGKEGLVAPLQWDGTGTDHAILTNSPSQLDIVPGDTVRTSGISSVYPADIPLGVTTGSRLIDGAVHVVDVKLFQDFAKLRYVIIAENPDRKTIEELEQ